jgi:hypothetical protein
VHDLRHNVPRAWKSLWAHPMVLPCTVCQVELVSVRLEIVLISVQDRCTVCAERTIGLETILDAPYGTPSDVGQVEACFGPLLISVQDRCTVCVECTTGLEIILGTPDGTPR